jgi:hypothetical protein
MGTAYEVERALAEQAAAERDLLAATVRWSLAAAAADDHRLRVDALAQARHALDAAFHQAVYAANAGGWSWRELEGPAGVRWQTLYRRYRQPPARRVRLRVLPRRWRATGRVPLPYRRRR